MYIKQYFRALGQCMLIFNFYMQILSVVHCYLAERWLSEKEVEKANSQ